MPRWVWVFVVAGIVVALGFIVTLIAGVDHGPSLHRPGETPSEQSPAPR
jgi:hypothetical protein